MLKPNHITAGRGLLRWSQEDLAKASGVSGRTINLIENEKQNASQETLLGIQMAFDRAGVVFRDNGVFIEDRRMTVLEGANRLTRLFDDISFVLQNGGELLIDGADEKLTPKALITKVASLRTAGMKMRHLIKSGDRYLRGRLSEYRWIPEAFFVNQAIFIYGDTVAIDAFSNNTLFIHRDPQLASFLKNRFDMLGIFSLNLIVVKHKMSSIYRIQVLHNESAGNDIGRLQISVGQQYHEGEKLLAGIMWAKRNFKEVRINICDALQRHNFMFYGFSPFEAYDLAISNGDKWRERNALMLALVPPENITRWEDWKKHKDWHICWQKINFLFHEDKDFRCSVESSVKKIWLRNVEKKSFESNKETEFFKFSTQYILEETAISMLMTEKGVTEIYPGTFADALFFLRERQLLDISMTSLTFKKKQIAKAVA